MFGLTPSDIDLIIKTLRAHPDVEEAIVFGSRAMGNFKPGSDVDIALKGNLGPETCTDIAVELNERLPLPYKFDVLAYPALSDKPLIEHIDHYGKVLYKKGRKSKGTSSD
jgi:predicted nucleotidyltransferase